MLPQRRQSRHNSRYVFLCTGWTPAEAAVKSQGNMPLRQCWPGGQRRVLHQPTVPRLSAAPTAPALACAIFSSSFAVGPSLSLFCLSFLSPPLRQLPFYLNLTLEADAQTFTCYGLLSLWEDAQAPLWEARQHRTRHTELSYSGTLPLGLIVTE